MTGRALDPYGSPESEQAVAIVAHRLIRESRIAPENIDQSYDRRVALIGELVLACEIAGANETRVLQEQGADPVGAERLTRVLKNPAVSEYISSLRFPGAEDIPGVKETETGIELDAAAFVEGILNQTDEY
jgi:hypothetical protein